MLWCLSVLVLLIWGASSAPLDSKDSSGLVDEVLSKLNDYVTEKNLNVLHLPEVEDDRYHVKKEFQNGLLKDLGTVARIGKSTVTPETGGEVVNWVIESKVGLKSLVVEYDFRFRALSGILKYDGHLVVRADTNVLDLEATVVTDRKLGSCNLVVNDVAIVGLGDFRVTIDRSGFFRGLLERMVEYLLYYVVPLMREGINVELHNFIRTYPVNSNITQNICEYFMPK